MYYMNYQVERLSAVAKVRHLDMELNNISGIVGYTFNYSELSGQSLCVVSVTA